MSVRSGNSGLRNDDRLGTMNSRKILKSCRSLFAYSQPINLGSQAVIAGVRTQLVDNESNPDSFTPTMLWNPINNRINLQDAKVNDYIDIDIIISGISVGSILQASIQLDFSPGLDGSQVVSAPVTRFLVVGPTLHSLHFSFKFVVTTPMKENGIGVMDHSNFHP